MSRMDTDGFQKIGHLGDEVTLDELIKKRKRRDQEERGRFLGKERFKSSCFIQETVCEACYMSLDYCISTL